MRDQNPREKLKSQRGPKRVGSSIGRVTPGDDKAVAREIERLAWEVEQLKRRKGTTRFYQTYQNLPVFPAMVNGDWSTVVADVNCYHGWKLRVDDPLVDGSWLAWYALIGPKQVGWNFRSVFHTGPDYGDLEFYVDDYLLASEDCYSAAPGYNFQGLLFEVFASGPAKAKFTAGGGGVDGGPGWHRFLIRVNGKDAESTGYNAAISEAWIRADFGGIVADYDEDGDTLGSPYWIFPT